MKVMFQEQEPGAPSACVVHEQSSPGQFKQSPDSPAPTHEHSEYPESWSHHAQLEVDLQSSLTLQRRDFASSEHVPPVTKDCAIAPVARDRF